MNQATELGPVDMSSTCQGHMTIPVLEFLNGTPWNDMTKSLVSALRPSSVQICRDSCNLMSINWRVTVWLWPDDRIKRIEQEVNYSVYGVPKCEPNVFPEFPYDSHDLYKLTKTT